jgi:hypothetical protein
MLQLVTIVFNEKQCHASYHDNLLKTFQLSNNTDQKGEIFEKFDTQGFARFFSLFQYQIVFKSQKVAIGILSNLNSVRFQENFFILQLFRIKNAFSVILKNRVYKKVRGLKPIKKHSTKKHLKA